MNSNCMYESGLENALTHMRLNNEAGGSILFTKNGKLQADPIALPSKEKGCVFFPAILLQGGQGGAACTVNFGGSPFHFSPPPGYSALQLSDALYSNSDREAYLTGSYRRTPLVFIFFQHLFILYFIQFSSIVCAHRCRQSWWSPRWSWPNRPTSASPTCASASRLPRSPASCSQERQATRGRVTLGPLCPIDRCSPCLSSHPHRLLLSLRKRREGGAEADIIVGTMGKVVHLWLQRSTPSY